MTKRAAVYVRISDDREGAGLGVARQEQDCGELADRLGIEVVEVYVDNDVSAYRSRSRPSYLRLLDDVQAGRVDVVLAWHTDRLHRSPRELEDWVDACERGGVVVHTVRGGPIDLATPSGRVMARTLGAFARYESEHKSDRGRRKAEELAHAGKVSGGGDRPFGYEPDRLTVREEEADVVRDMARRVLAGEGVRGVADDLNRRGIATTRGKRWSSYTTRRLLMSARIAGQREHHGEVVAEAVWPAIISPEDSTRLRALLGDPSRRTGAGGTPRYLLTSLLRCGKCGRGMVGRPNEHGQRRYVCNRTPGTASCGKTYAMAEPVEEYIVELALSALDSPDLLRARWTVEDDDTSSAGGTAYEALLAVQADLDGLAEDVGAGRITRREWMVARAGLQRRAEELEEQLARGRETSALDAEDVRGGVRAAWPELSRDRRRALLDVVLDRVVVHPGRRGYNRFDPDRYELVWRA